MGMTNKEFLCPYCGSRNEISLETGEGKQHKLVTDCAICCRPIVIQVRIMGDDYELGVHAENE